jgi:hypothetical protein
MCPDLVGADLATSNLTHGAGKKGHRKNLIYGNVSMTLAKIEHSSLVQY